MTSFEERMEKASAVYLEWSAVDDPDDIEECRRQTRLVIEAFLDGDPVYEIDAEYEPYFPTQPRNLKSDESRAFYLLLRNKLLVRLEVPEDG